MKALDRRIIYVLTLIALAIPLLCDYAVEPVRMVSAERFFNEVEALKFAEGDIAFVAFDFGPNSIAENGSQGEVVLEHLFRRRIPAALFSTYNLAEPLLVSIPESIAKRLNKETGEVWEYGRDWVNLGFRPGGAIQVQAIPKADSLIDVFGKDARGNYLKDLPAFSKVGSISSVKFLAQFTGLVGVFDLYVQFFQKDGYRPKFGHGCTSITIPEAFTYLDSGQINGLLEGVAGSAWYSVLLSRKYPKREVDSAMKINTSLGVAHLVIILLVIVGNVVGLFFSKGT